MVLLHTAIAYGPLPTAEGQEMVKEGSREDQVANISTLLPYFTISLRLRLEDPFAKTIYFPHVKSLPGPG